MQISVGGMQGNAVFQKPGGGIQKREPECFGIGKGLRFKQDNDLQIHISIGSIRKQGATIGSLFGLLFRLFSFYCLLSFVRPACIFLFDRA